VSNLAKEGVCDLWIVFVVVGARILSSTGPAGGTGGGVCDGSGGGTTDLVHI
jgi:hypothetical protein